ncbi:MAG: tetratricopeptide repeat protein [Deltaproteobacteria bacterium]|nr:tetratricopeptide repeat protein [Deltaproteobacteria bacterium]
MARRHVVTLFLLFFVLVVVTTGCGPKTEEEYFNQADKDYVKGRFKEAARRFQEYLSEFPEGKRRDVALFRSGEILYYTLEQKPAAVKYFSQLVNQFPSSDYTYKAREIMAAAFRDETHDYPLAIEEFRWLTQHSPSAGQAAEMQFQVARCFLLSENLEQAILEFAKILGAGPPPDLAEKVYDELGSAHLNLGQIEEALYIHKNHINRFPNSPLAQVAEFKMANALEELNSLSEAMKIYQGLLDRYHNRQAVEVRIAAIKDRLKNSQTQAKEMDYSYRPEINEDKENKNAPPTPAPATSPGAKVQGLKSQTRDKKGR